jgi:hypothetical protein
MTIASWKLGWFYEKLESSYVAEKVKSSINMYLS